MKAAKVKKKKLSEYEILKSSTDSWKIYTYRQSRGICTSLLPNSLLLRPPMLFIPSRKHAACHRNAANTGPGGQEVCFTVSTQWFVWSQSIQSLRSMRRFDWRCDGQKVHPRVVQEFQECLIWPARLSTWKEDVQTPQWGTKKVQWKGIKNKKN